jgi:negative regulator of sigma E activity
MNSSDEEKLTQWIDGEIDDAEVEELLAANPELRAEKEAARSLGKLLKGELKGGEEIPFPEFFNRQVHRFIEEERKIEEQQAAYADATEKTLFPWFHFWRNAAAAALLVLLGVFIGVAFFDSRETGSRIVSTYTPDPGVAAKLFYHDDAKATVLLLDGLQAIPASHEITGHQTANYRPGPGNYFSALFSTANEPALVLVKDGADIPHIYEVDLALPN